MSSAIDVKPAAMENRRDYDIFLAAVGYEARARYVVQKLRPNARRKVALAFPHSKVLDYSANLSYLSKAGYDVHELEDGKIESWFRDEFISVTSDSESEIRVGIDISSLSRIRIATVFDVIRSLSAQIGLRVIVDWYYSIARYSVPQRGFVPNAIVGPVLPSFAGWTNEPERPLVAVVGLGYEEDKALGAVEHVQASAAYAMKPISLDPRYDVAVTLANRRFLDSVRPNQVLDYRIEQPIDCFGMLESVVYGLLRSFNVIVLPFGPKVFTLCSLLVAGLHPTVSIWRVSAGGADIPVNRRASGRIACLTATFAALSPESEQAV